jgi:hypothetical protein
MSLLDCTHKWVAKYEESGDQVGWMCQRCWLFISEPITRMNKRLNEDQTYRESMSKVMRFGLVVLFVGVLIDVLFSCYMILNGGMR